MPPLRNVVRRAWGALALTLPLAAAALEINDASRAQLEQLNGLGVPTVAAILAEREKNGPFTGWADLQRRVKGFKEKRLAQLDRQGLTVNGQPLPRAETRQ
jgi:DNA uptake protein ComE-like DNA-binding protein